MGPLTVKDFIFEPESTEVVPCTIDFDHKGESFRIDNSKIIAEVVNLQLNKDTLRPDIWLALYEEAQRWAHSLSLVKKIIHTYYSQPVLLDGTWVPHDVQALRTVFTRAVDSSAVDRSGSARTLPRNSKDNQLYVLKLCSYFVDVHQECYYYIHSNLSNNTPTDPGTISTLYRYRKNHTDKLLRYLELESSLTAEQKTALYDRVRNLPRIPEEMQQRLRGDTLREGPSSQFTTTSTSTSAASSTSNKNCPETDAMLTGSRRRKTPNSAGSLRATNTYHLQTRSIPPYRASGDAPVTPHHSRLRHVSDSFVVQGDSGASTSYISESVQLQLPGLRPNETASSSRGETVSYHTILPSRSANRVDPHSEASYYLPNHSSHPVLPQGPLRPDPTPTHPELIGRTTSRAAAHPITRDRIAISDLLG